MVTWRQRFEDLIFEENNLETPTTIRSRKLRETIEAHLSDLINEGIFSFNAENTKAYDLFDSKASNYCTETILMTQELWDQISGDPILSCSGNWSYEDE